MNESFNHIRDCINRGWREQDNSHLKMNALELGSFACSTLELDNFTWSVVKLDNSRFGDFDDSKANDKS